MSASTERTKTSPVVVNLTMAQIRAVAHLHRELLSMAVARKAGMLVAQVFDDHMRIGIVRNPEAVKIAKDATKLIYEAPERTAKRNAKYEKQLK
jgi:hypothetical protein